MNRGLMNRRLWIWPLLPLVVACSRNDSPGDGSRGGQESGGSSGSGHGASGGSLIVDVPQGGGGTNQNEPPTYVPPEPDDNCGTRCYRDSSLDDGAPQAFEGPVTNEHRPVIVYPLEGAMHPINIGEITFQWARESSQELFRIRVSGGATSWDFFVPCQPVPGGSSTECSYTLPQNSWLALAYGFRGEDVTITITGTTGAGEPLSESEPLEASFSPWVVQGGLYYWSTALPGTYRLVFGSPRATPFIAPQTQENPSTCSGCHSLSRSGNAIAFTGGPVAADGYLRVAPTDNPSAPTFTPSTEHDSAMPALNPDGSLVAVAYDHKMVVRDAETGDLLSEVPDTALAPHGTPYFPEWSPDGSEIVVTLSLEPDSQWAVRSGKIAVLPYNDGNWGSAEVIVDDDFINFYPSYSPDGKWIVFASAPATNGRISYDQADARLRLVSRNGGQVYDLTRATQAIGQASTWPKFSPFQQADGQVLFITFNSKIDYGFLLKNSVADLPNPQLWFAAIDLRNLQSGDPSYAPVWLPFQETDQKNHLGFWTEDVPCDVDKGSRCGVDENCVAKSCQIVR